MITHVLMAKLTEDAGDEQVRALIDGLYTASRAADGVIDYRIERDAGLRPGNDDLVLVARFADEDAFRAYLTHPQHLAVLREHAPGLLAGSHQVQFVSEDR